MLINISRACACPSTACCEGTLYYASVNASCGDANEVIERKPCLASRARSRGPLCIMGRSEEVHQGHGRLYERSLATSEESEVVDIFTCNHVRGSSGLIASYKHKLFQRDSMPYQIVRISSESLRIGTGSSEHPAGHWRMRFELSSLDSWIQH